MSLDLAFSPLKKAHLDSAVTPYTTGGEVLVPPRCPHFEACGGCHLQHYSYQDQLDIKVRQLEDLFAQHGLESTGIHDRVHGMEDPWHYRNKADFNAKVYGGQIRLGFSETGTSRVIDVNCCVIVSKLINECLDGFKKLLPDFPEIKRKLHSLILRSSFRDEQVVAVYHTKLKDPAVFGRLTAGVRADHPVLIGGGFVKKGKGIGEGDLRLREDVRGIEYSYSPASFFQANPVQTDVLARIVEEYADPRPSDVVLDLYSGVGLFSLLLGQSVREVYAVEDTPCAVKDAAENAQALGVRNCHFLRGQAEERLSQLFRTGVRPTVAVLDPPRSGCHESVLSVLQQLQVPRIVHVSCNPRALARDVQKLVRGGYRLRSLSLVDMFPQTSHMECVAYLSV